MNTKDRIKVLENKMDEVVHRLKGVLFALDEDKDIDLTTTDAGSLSKTGLRFPHTYYFDLNFGPRAKKQRELSNDLSMMGVKYIKQQGFSEASRDRIVDSEHNIQLILEHLDLERDDEPRLVEVAKEEKP